MKCPKCHHVNEAGAKECDDCGVQFVDIRGGRGARSKADHVGRDCPFNDHGAVCGKPGSLSDSVLGGGPWYCPEHYWLLKGRTITQLDAAKSHVTYRERWYAERGLPYEPPKSGTLYALMQRHAREPGDDDEPIAA